MTRNIRLNIEYDGEDFCGWQRQLELPTIQGVLEEKIAKVAGTRVPLYGAGRTDSGVHARGQVANFFVEEGSTIPAERWSLVLNTKLPASIRITSSYEVPMSFHSQKSAVSKIYEYRILNRNFSSALDRRVYFCPHPLNWDKIALALPHFLGERDFKSFQSGPTQVKSTIRKVTRFELIPEGNGVYCFRVQGNGFLKQMVRNMVGTVLEVGQGLREPEEIEKIFSGRDREFAGRAAPSRGLCLVEVLYA